jgi:8-oxo-dGTP diphosphatase
MSQDTDDTVYTVVFSDKGFLMVYNPKRSGWEMPGGHVREGEDREDAAVREFREEAGYTVRIAAIRDLGYCRVFAGIVEGEKQPCEMDAEFFTELPDTLAFEREEYEDVVPWAKNALIEMGYLTRKRTSI